MKWFGSRRKKKILYHTSYWLGSKNKNNCSSPVTSDSIYFSFFVINTYLSPSSLSIYIYVYMLNLEKYEKYIYIYIYNACSFLSSSSSPSPFFSLLFFNLFISFLFVNNLIILFSRLFLNIFWLYVCMGDCMSPTLPLSLSFSLTSFPLSLSLYIYIYIYQNDVPYKLD